MRFNFFYIYIKAGGAIYKPRDANNLSWNAFGSENKVNNVYDSLDTQTSRVVEMSMNKISIGMENE